MKKLFAVLMAIALVLSMGTTFAFAADTGKIQITNAIEGADYTIYKMLNFTPSNAAGDKGIYTIVAGWEAFFAAAPATDYFALTTNAGQTTVALKEGVTAVDQTLAKAALKYAEDNNITATAKQEAESATVIFDGLDFGYYAIDTTVGTMGALTRADNELTAVEKNEKPDIDKFVQEDSEINNADEGWGKVNDADIDQQVNYKSTITVGVGATNYVMHDTMEAGLTFNNDVKVYVGGVEVPVANYTVTYPATDGHTFDVAFDNAYIATLAKGTEIEVKYSATLNENANIVVDGNDNTVYLSYGEDSTWETAEHKTTTYTWKMDVLKFTMDGDTKVVLAGAKFQLLGQDGEAIQFVRLADTDGVPTYRVAVDADATREGVTVIDTIETEAATGKFIILGLDEGKYKLRETEAPVGYNKIAADLDVIITSEYKDADLTATYEINDKTPATIEVENKTGGLFPETGGIGTTIFYMVGGLLMLAAFVVLVSKKRMSAAV